MTDLSETTGERRVTLKSAEELLVKAERALADHRRVVAYRMFCQSIALFESAGDLDDAAFINRLAKICESCSYSAYQIFFYRKQRQVDTPWLLLGNQWTRKAADLYDRTLGALVSSASQEAVLDQIFRMIRLGGESIRAQQYAEAETALMHANELHLQLAEADESDVDTKLWLLTNLNLAKAIIGSGDIDKARTTIDAALGTTTPAGEESKLALQTYAELCNLKATVVKPQRADDQD